jgi:hypothetical protein
MRRTSTLLVIVCVAPLLGVATQESGQPKTLAGHLTVATSTNGRTTAVAGRQSAAGEPEFLFCISHSESNVKKVEYKGPGKVTYIPQAIAGLPPGVKIEGPERIAPMLAVVPESGAPMVFLSIGQKAPADASLKGATTFKVAMVSRMDWARENGPRRGTDMAGCLSAGG